MHKIHHTSTKIQELTMQSQRGHSGVRIIIFTIHGLYLQFTNYIYT